MGFLSPIAALIAAGIAVPALVALYFLKLRRRELAVPSTLLWKRAVQDMQVNAPFQRLRKNLLLLLQLLLLAALLVAMARPTTESAARPGQRVAILIDHSGSMNATDGSPTRLDTAKAAALDIIDSLGSAADSEGDAGAGAAMVVSFAETATTVQGLTNDPAALRAAVQRIAPTDQRSRLGDALALVQRLAPSDEQTGGGLMVYILTDGQVHMPESAALASHGVEVRYLPIGDGDSEGAADNLGIVSFSARRDFERPEMVQVFARIINAGVGPRQANLELRLDGQLNRVQAISVPSRLIQESGSTTPGSQSVQFEFMLPESAMIELRHDYDDLLAADNTVRMHLAPSRRLRVLLVTSGNAFLERVIRSVGVRQLVLMHPDRYEDQDPDRLRRGGWDAPGVTANVAEGFDVIVFDSYAPQQVPTVDSLYFGAAPPLEGLALRAADEDDPAAQVLLDWQRDHALLRYVVMDDVVLRQPGRLVVPADAQVLATGQTGPMMATVRREGVSHVVTSFDVLETNWPLYVSFPVFVSNVVQQLGLGALADQAGLAYRTGEVAALPAPADGSAMTYTGPLTLRADSGRGQQAILPPFTQVGIYATSADIAPPFDRLPVNLLDDVESDILPAGELAIGSTAIAAQDKSEVIHHEVWPWFAWGALGLLMIEWMVYTKRMHL